MNAPPYSASAFTMAKTGVGLGIGVSLGDGVMEGVVVGGWVSVGGIGVADWVGVLVGGSVGVIVLVDVGKSVGRATCPQNAAPTPLRPRKKMIRTRVAAPPRVKPNRVRGRKPMITRVIAPKRDARARCTANTTSPSGHKCGIPLPNPNPAMDNGRKISYDNATPAIAARLL